MAKQESTTATPKVTKEELEGFEEDDEFEEFEATGICFVPFYFVLLIAE